MFILVSVVLLLYWLQYRDESLANVRYDFFREQLAANNIESVLIEEEMIYGTWKKPPERKLEDSATTPPPKADADSEKSKPALFAAS